MALFFVMFNFKDLDSGNVIYRNMSDKLLSIVLKTSLVAIVLSLLAMCKPSEKVYTVEGNTSSDIQAMIDKAFEK